jgi:hypothetical protein
MFKRAYIVFVLALLTCAVATSAFAAGNDLRHGAIGASVIWGGGLDDPGGPGRTKPGPTGLVWGGGPAPPPTGRRALFNRASYNFPTSYPSPINRYDWSRWFNWLNRPD